MPGWKPPNALLYLGSLVRPGLLKPDLKVPTIGHVDWQALRKEGFDAVVIDKDNCLTLPEQDHLYPPLQTAWQTLLSAFPPGRVLIVSNSAGTLSKDPSGVAPLLIITLRKAEMQAESVSLSLRAPVLLHARPKPGCATDIISYLSPDASGGLPGPSTLRARIAQNHRDALQAEKEDVEALVKRFDDLVSGPVWRQGEGPSEEPGRGRDLFRQSFTDEKLRQHAASLRTPTLDQTAASISSLASLKQPLTAHLVEPESSKPDSDGKRIPYGPRIAVVGDRLFTDTLLANRLRLLLPSSSGRDSVISIQTTSLPDPKDVRLLRRLESLVTRDRLRSGPTDWGRFAISDSPPATTPEASGGWRRYIPFRQAYLAAPPLQWDPRSWRPITLLAAGGRAALWLGRFMGTQVRRGGRWALESGKRWYAQGKVGQEEIKNISKEGMP